MTDLNARLSAIGERHECLLIASEREDASIAIMSLAIPIHKQGRGVGRAVMQDVLALADESGVLVRLELSEESSSFAGEWYERLGFEFTGECGEWGEIAVRQPSPRPAP